MRDELELKLQEEFGFMKQNRVDTEKNLYYRFGCDCDDGWYELIHDCCKAIKEEYEKANVAVDFVPAQIKEKFGTLRFYYGYEDAPHRISAIDFLGSGLSIRFQPDGEDGEKKELRDAIAQIVHHAEERSFHICERCGEEGDSVTVRTEFPRIRCLCEQCYSIYDQILEERRLKNREKAKAILDEIQARKEENGAE